MTILTRYPRITLAVGLLLVLAGTAWLAGGCGCSGSSSSSSSPAEGDAS